GDNPEKRCPAVWQAYETYVASTPTFEEVKVLGLYCTNVGQFATSNKAINGVNDLSGMKLRSPAPATNEALGLLGAVPLNKPASEIYELASGGMIDGAVIPLDSIVDFNLHGVFKKINTIPGGMVSTVIVLPVNKAAWDKISPADQEAILSVSGQA